MDNYVGKRIDGRYEILELVGMGGMANVYRAYDNIDDRIVAVKILKDEYLGNQEFIRRFKNESKAIAVLSHPNIVKVYDVSFGDKIQYIVMEYVDGITLKEYIDQQEDIKWKEIVHFTIQILKALQHAHERGIIHRDIKPQNILLLRDGSIKVADFGIARFSRSETRTMTDKAIGSVHYISPEQARGDITDEKSDIYSVGVMLYEMLTGTLPFESDNAVSVAIMQMQTEPKKPRNIKEGIPEGLEEITMKAMQKDPKNRYDSVSEMLSSIEAFQNNPSIRFEYKYFLDNSPTKYVNAINTVKSSNNYGDNFEYEEEDKKKKKTTMIISGIAAAVLIIGIVFGSMLIFKSCENESLKDVDVPNFIGMKFSDVQNSSEYKFNWKVESVYDATKAEGIIIDQEPKSGAKKIKEDATITLKVNSSGTLVTIPAVKGMTEDAAIAKLNEIGVKYEVLSIIDNETAAGIVKGTDPVEGSKVAASSAIKIYVSKGPTEEKVAVPDVINKSLSTAKNDLIAKGFVVSDSIATEESDKPKDTVLSTDPLPGVSVAKGSTIKLTVSSGVKQQTTISFSVDLPDNVDKVISVSTYIDGVLDSTKPVKPSYVSSKYNVDVKGNSGTKTVNIELDGSLYKVYTVNFDVSTNPVKLVSQYPYVPKTDSSSSSVS